MSNRIKTECGDKKIDAPSKITSSPRTILNLQFFCKLPFVHLHPAMKVFFLFTVTWKTSKILAWPEMKKKKSF